MWTNRILTPNHFFFVFVFFFHFGTPNINQDLLSYWASLFWDKCHKPHATISIYNEPFTMSYSLKPYSDLIPTFELFFGFPEKLYFDWSANYFTVSMFNLNGICPPIKLLGYQSSPPSRVQNWRKWLTLLIISR